jgi:GTP-binding protein
VAVHLASAFEQWPMFEHLLPEIALAGHSNCGKSTLINALAGIEPKRGPASVSDRAGWTEKIEFYRIGKKPPILTLVREFFFL